jgi:hypothetical protein
MPACDALMCSGDRPRIEADASMRPKGRTPGWSDRPELRMTRAVRFVVAQPGCLTRI